MDPKSRDLNSGSGGDPDEFTAARKRSRRVSFAETTAVHVFPRDEDFETPPDSSKPLNEGTREELGFEGDHHSDSDDSRVSARGEDGDEDDDDDDEGGEQERFIRDMGSSSPGSVAGSVTSNDDDNFFGPVSTSFIKSGRLSEAGMSDDNNHDITLDSTAFSLHFQNVVPPNDCTANSVGSLRTPTGDSMPTDSDIFLVHKGFKKQVPRSKLSDGKMGGSAGDSSNMSFIVENPDKYDDYGRMSPTLETLLAEANKSVKANTPNSSSDTRASLHDDGILAVAPESEKDEAHACDKNTIGNAAGQNENHIAAPNKIASLPIDATMIEKPQATISPKVNSYYKDVLEVTQSNSVASDVQSIGMLSPPYRRSPKSLTFQSGQIHQELLRAQLSQNYSDSSPHSMSTHPAMENLDSQYDMQTPKSLVQSLQTLQQGSVSSLRGKRQQLFLDPAVLSQDRLMQTPDKEEPLSSLKMKLVQHGERISAIKIPMSTIYKSPVIIDSRSVLSEKDSLPHEFKGTLEGYNVKHKGVSANNENSIDAARGIYGHTVDLQLNHSENLNANTENNSLMNVSQEDNGPTSRLQLNHSGYVATNHSSTNVENKEVVGGAVKLTTSMSSFQLSQSKSNWKENPIQGVSLGKLHGSSIGQTKLMQSSQSLGTLCLPSGISSPIRMLGDELSAPEGGHFSPRVDGSPSSSSSLGINRLPSSISSPIPNSNGVSNLQGSNELEKNNSPICNSQKQLEESRNILLESQDQDTAMTNNLVNVKDNLAVKDKISSNEPGFPDANKLKETMSTKPTEFLAEGTNQNLNYKNDGDNNMLHSYNLKELVPSKPTQDPSLYDDELIRQDLQPIEESHSVQTEISGKKRGIHQIRLTDEDHLGETCRIQKSPKLLSDFVGKNVSGHNLQQSEEPQNIEGQAPQKHWTCIFSKVSEATKQIISPSVCMLNSQELDILEEIFGELQKARKYERLYSSLQNHNFLGDVQQKRVAEARSLLDKLVYEKAMLQLKRMKLDQLSNKAQLFKSKIQECAKLKSIYAQICAHDTRSVQHQEHQLHPDSNNSCTRDQAGNNSVTPMRQELEMLDQKLKRLMKFFETSCKMKGNMSCDEILEVVNDHIHMKNRCRLIQQDLQLWKISDIIKKDEQCEIVLNYRNILFQRFTIHSGSISSIVVNNILENESIEKKFPSMNPCTPFEFVFKAMENRRVASSKQLSQETLKTSLLLGTLLEVLEEVLASRMESWNLVSSTFYLQGSGQLILQLAFLSFKSGRKVTLSLDLTNLNCGVYPSKPSDILIKISEAKSTLAHSISDEIMGAAESLESGRLMIVRLCRSISKVVQDSEGT